MNLKTKARLIDLFWLMWLVCVVICTVVGLSFIGGIVARAEGKGEGMSNPLTESARLALVKSVARSVFDNFESFRDDHIGADLAYLVMAIVEDDACNVDWTEEGYGGECELLKAMRTLYPDPRHDVWSFIIKDD